MLSPLRSRLCQRIALAAFVAILAAEIVVLFALPNLSDSFVTAVVVALVIAAAGAAFIATTSYWAIALPIAQIREAIRHPEGNNKMPVARNDEIGGLARTIARGREHHEKVIADQTTEIAAREASMRATLENMDEGVAMYDANLKLVIWNERMRKLLGVPDEFFDREHTFPEYLRYVGVRGEFGRMVDVEAEVQKRLATLGRKLTYERIRPDGTVIEITRNPMPEGGFIEIFSDITER
jgi:PAS domain-containing protein